MPLCPTCQNYIQENTICGSCYSKQYRIDKAKLKQDLKTKSRFSKFSDKPKSNRTIELDKLKAKLQSLWSAKVKTFARENGLYFDWIDGKANSNKGLFGLHVAHYYPKGTIWQLWTDPINSGLTSYNHNVNKPETAPMMRKQMVKVWGEQAVNELDQRAEDCRLRISLGIDKRRPDEMILKGLILELKNKNNKIEK